MVPEKVYHGSLLPKEGDCLRGSAMVGRDVPREPTHCCRMLHPSAAGGGRSQTERDELAAHSCTYPESKDTGFSLLKLTSSPDG